MRYKRLFLELFLASIVWGILIVSCTAGNQDIDMQIQDYDYVFYFSEFCGGKVSKRDWYTNDYAVEFDKSGEPSKINLIDTYSCVDYLGECINAEIYPNLEVRLTERCTYSATQLK